jgi:hypothetical protein
LTTVDGRKVSINIIKWWFTCWSEYPILSTLTLDLATVLLESSNLECKFSDALNIFTDKRNGLKLSIIKALMLLKLGY